ncbi:polysaccharide biosynthesis C-terminal domain-containing protein, partial [Bacteroidia bacterium]|nr:polysaccharide biosynthesis C-terminal domain-containing protein [Bacteroidia bacterium]MDC1395254.1 polysaccharide biosynthesis C-terminal domain-containing protein [Bacteroidia bacterium]
IIGMCCVQPFIMLSVSYASNQGRIAVPSALLQLIKLVQPFFVVLYFLDYISFDGLIYALLGYYFLLVVLYVGYAISQDSFVPTLNFKEIKNTLPLKSMLTFAGYSVLGSIGAVLTNQVDILMVTSMLGKYQTGLYGWSLFIVNAIAIPYGLIGSISTPLISKYWKEEKHQELNKIYIQSSSSLMVISIGLFLSVIAGIDDLFLLMPKGQEYSQAKSIVILLGIAKIIDMASGLNNQIFSMSSKYKVLMLFLFVAVIVNVGLNLVFIPKYGVDGSAYATIVSIVIYNLLKYTFLKKNFDLDPFSRNTIEILLLTIGILLLGQLIPITNLPFVNILLKSGITFMLFYTTAYFLRLSPELNDFANKQLRRFGMPTVD